MGNRLIVAILTVVALPAISLLLLAQSAQQPAATTPAPDLTGVWDGGAKLWFTREEPSMLPWAAEKYKEVRKGMRGFDQVHTDMGRSDFDPAQYPYCMPYGLPRAYA
jgi:hypothetical protein